MSITHAADEETSFTGDDTVETTQLNRIERKLDDVIAIAEKVEKIVETIAAEVKPTLDTLMNHPMLKMFLANKKGK